MALCGPASPTGCRRRTPGEGGPWAEWGPATPTGPSAGASSSPRDGLAMPPCILVQSPPVLVLLELAEPDCGVTVLPRPVGVLDCVLLLSEPASWRSCFSGSCPTRSLFLRGSLVSPV